MIHLIYHGDEKTRELLIHGKTLPPSGTCTIDHIRQLRSTCRVNPAKQTVQGMKDAAAFLDVLKKESDEISRGIKLESFILVPSNLTVSNT